MDIKNSLKICIKALQSNKPRSILTILGIVIGISSIILIVSIGQGAKYLIINQIQSYGSRTISIEPGTMSKDISSMATSMFSDSLKEKDLIALRKKSNVPHLVDLAPIIMVKGGQVVYQKEVFSAMTFGTSELLIKILQLDLQEGSFFTQQDIDQYANVAVIGSNIKDSFFGMSSSINKKIKIKNKTFKVIGALAPTGQVSMMNIDNLVLLPYTTTQKYISKQDHYEEIIAQAQTEELVPRTAYDIAATLRESHGITHPKNDDFSVLTQADSIEMISIVTGILTILLVSVAAISLVVGGIGIMNIMLVSVTQRIREIGLRKAVGATKKDILGQFLLEAIILTVVGGIIGIILGILGGIIVSLILNKILSVGTWPFIFSVWAAFLGVGVSVLTGVIFGILPARKAANLNPAEALRRE